MTMSKPEIGQWYQRLDKGELFQVAGIDEDAGTIELQSFSGDLDEIEADSWDELSPAVAEPPEDWTGPMDDIESDDLGFSDTEPRGMNWTQPQEPLGFEAWDDTRDGVSTENAPLAGDQEN